MRAPSAAPRRRRSITWSLALILAVAVFLVQGLASLIWLHEQFLGRVEAVAEAAVERAASIREMALASAPGELSATLELLADRRTAISADAEAFAERHRSWAHATRVLDELDVSRVPTGTRVAIVVPKGKGRREAPRALMLSLPLDGRWLNIEYTLDASTSGSEMRGVFWALMLSLCVTGIAIFAISRATRPLRELALAAERLGRDPDAPALAERGGRETVQAIRAFNRMQTSLRESLRDRTRMLGALSHDLRTQLTRLRLRIEAIPEPEQQRLARTEIETMQAMVEGVLDFARDDAADEAPRDIDLAAMLRTLVDERTDAGEAASFEGPDRRPWRGRPVALRRAFDNLIANAVRYGGGARVELTNARMGDAADRDGDPAPAPEIRITDPGPGIPEDARLRVLEPFVRLDESRSESGGGTGLGLAVALAVIRLHGGTLTFEDAQDGFATVVQFPSAHRART